MAQPGTKTNALGTAVVTIVVMAVAAVFGFGGDPPVRELKQNGQQIELSSVPGLIADSQIFPREKSLGIVVFYNSASYRPRVVQVTMTYHGETTELDLDPDSGMREATPFVLPHSIIHGWYAVMQYDGSPIRFAIRDKVIHLYRSSYYTGIACGLWVSDGLQYPEYVDFRVRANAVVCSHRS